MEDKLLYEITRFKQLSGLSLINEQGVIDNLLSLSGKRIKNVDDIINALNLSGKELTDTDIDKFCNELKGTGAMLDSELNLLRNELKANVKLRSALSKQSEDFVLAIKNTKNMKNLVGLAGVNILNKAQMMAILVKVTRELLDLTNSITRQSFDNIDNGFVTTLNKIFDNGFGLHNIDEIWDIIDGFILEKVNTSGLSPDLAEAQFKEFSKRIKENSKTKDLIDKFNSSGRNAGKPKRTTSLTKYSTDYKLPDGLLGAKTWVNVDEAGKGVKYSDSVPAKVDGDNLPAKVDDGTDKIPSTIDEVEGIFDEYELIDGGTPGRDPFPNGVPERRFFNNFFFKYCKLDFCEVIINLLRSLGKSPADFVDDMINTQNKIIELSNKLENMNPGDSGYISVKFELDGYVNRMKSNMRMMATPDAGFLTQWDSVKSQIKQTLGSEHSGLANRIIDYCETKSITSGGKTITGLDPLENFVELITKHTDEGAMGGFIFDIRKIATPEYWASWRNTDIVKYAKEVKDFYKKVKNSTNNRPTAFFKSLGKVCFDFLLTLLKRYANFMTFGTFRYYKTIIKRLSKGSFTSMEGLKRYAALYVQITIMSNIIEPFFNYVTDTFKNIIEFFNIYDFPEEDVSPQEKLINDLKGRIPGIGNTFEWNPFFNPIGFVPGVGEVGEFLGFEKAPLPQYIVDQIIEVIEFGYNQGEKKMDKNVVEERRKIMEAAFEQKTNEELEKLNSSAVTKYNLNKEGVEAKNDKVNIEKLINMYSDSNMVFENPNFDLLEPSETEKILNALTFTPGVSPDVENQVLGREKNKKRSVVDKDGNFIGVFYPNEEIKFIPNKLGEDAGYKPSQVIPKDSKVDYPDASTMLSDLSNISGYWSLKGKDGKLYLLKKQSGYLFFVTPSVDEIRKNPNKQLVMNDLQKFVPYLQ
jgi:hypothetical protein